MRMMKNGRDRKSYGASCVRPLCIILFVAVCVAYVNFATYNARVDPTIGLLVHSTAGVDPTISTSTSSNSSPLMCVPKRGVRPLRKREDLPALLEEHGLKSGVEVGVQEGKFAEYVLQNWKSCTSYKLVDIWAHQENYHDVANVADSAHNQYYEETMKRMKPFKDKVETFRMESLAAAQKIQKQSLDFAYIDARHDYCGVFEDIEAYWPLVKPGGIMAGHDYNENSEIRGQDWGLCYNGTRNERAVKGAVDDFFISKGLTITVSYYREQNFMTWMVQKPVPC